MGIRRRGMVGRVHAFKPDDPGTILGGDKNFKFYIGI